MRLAYTNYIVNDNHSQNGQEDLQWEPLLLESLWQPSLQEQDGAYIKIKKQGNAVDAADAADVAEAVLPVTARGRMYKA